MPLLTSESIVLRTYPLREADLIVNFFTRDQGKLRGVARRARRPKSGFGSSLERLTHSRISYFQKETRELVNIGDSEILNSQFSLASDYAAGVALDYMAELADHLLPPHEVNERFFRLMLAMLAHLREHRGQGAWPVVFYFTLWAVRLAGFLPDMHLNEESASFAREILATPIGQLPPHPYSRTFAAQLRRGLLLAIENHVERRLLTAPLIETLDPQSVN